MKVGPHGRCREIDSARVFAPRASTALLTVTGPGKNLPAVSDLPVLTGNGKLPKTAGLPDLPIGKPIQI